MGKYKVTSEINYCWFCDNTISKPEGKGPHFCCDECGEKYKKHRKKESARLKKLRLKQ